MEYWGQFIENYGYLAVFFGSAFDHNGSPSPLILAMALVARGELSLIPTLLIAFLGAYLADLLFFFLGRWMLTNRESKWLKWLEPNPKALKKGESIFNRFGSLIIIWGRFLTVVSRYLPFVCGYFYADVKKYATYAAIGNLLMVLIFGIAFRWFWEGLSHYLESPWWILGITFCLMLIQICITWIWWRGKGRRIEEEI